MKNSVVMRHQAFSLSVLLLLLSHGYAPAQNWHSVGPFASPWSICVSPDGIEIGTYQAGIARSTDNGLSWTFADGMPPKAYGVLPSNVISCIKRDPWDSRTVYAGVGLDNTATGHGFFKSTDGGQTWAQKNTGLPQWSAVPGISPHPFHRGELYIDVRADAGAGIYRSTDGGESWTLFFQNSYVHSTLVFDQGDSSLQYVPGIDGSVHSWHQGVHSVTPSPANFFGQGYPVASFLSPGSGSFFCMFRNNLYRCAGDGNWVSLLDSMQSGGAEDRLPLQRGLRQGARRPACQRGLRRVQVDR